MDQTVTQAMIVEQDAFYTKQAVERIAFFDADGVPVDLAALRDADEITMDNYVIAGAYSAIEDTDTVNEAIGKLEAKADSDDQDGSEVVLTGYTIAGAYTAVAETDTVNEAVGKVEKLATEPYGVVLTGYVIDGTGGALADTDTIMGAIAKLEKRVADIEAAP